MSHAYNFHLSSDDAEHEALLTSDWAAHIARLHADSDLGFSQEYEVNSLKV